MPPPPSSQEKGKQKEEQNHVPSLNETPNGTSNGTANGTASRGTTPGLGLSLNPAASTFTPAALPTQAGDAANGVAPQSTCLPLIPPPPFFFFLRFYSDHH